MILTVQDRAERMFLVELYESASRYEDMLSEIKSLILDIIHSDQPIPTFAEKDALIYAFRMNISDNSLPYRTAITQQPKYERLGETHHVELIENYKKKYTKIVADLIHDVCDLLDEIVKVENLPVQDLVFYLDKKGTFITLIQKVDSGIAFPEWKQKALECYQHAYELSNVLHYRNTARLHLIVHYSIYFHDDCGDVEKALSIACPELEKLTNHLNEYIENEDKYRKEIQIWQLLKDCVTMWTEESGIGPDE